MSQVSNQTELQQALAASDPLIEITSDFTISSQVTINYSVVIKSPDDTPMRTISRRTGYAGRLFSVSASGNLTLRDLLIDGNRVGTLATQPVLWTASVLTLDNTVVQNGSSTSPGGGIALGNNSAAACTLQNGSAVLGCASQGVGGGIFLDYNSRLDIKESRVVGNIAGAGGGIYINGHARLSSADSEISGNTATENGGGIFVDAYGCATLSGGAVTENSGGAGGGVFVNCGARFTNEHASISNNISTGGGGGVYISGSAAANLAECLIANNHADFGGGIFVNFDGVLKCSGSEIGGNSASSGGGIYENGSGSDAAVTDTRIINNNAGKGGGIFLNPGSAFACKGGEITGNTASSSGGGAFINAGSATIDGTSILENTGANGGGIFLNPDSRLSITDAQISGNTADANGGGMLLNAATLTLDGIAISDNRAAYGAGIFVNDNSHLTYLNGTLSGNTATEQGGAILLNGRGSRAQTGNSRITQNTASEGGGIYVSSGTLTAQNSDFTLNQASGNGGAILVSGGTVALMASPVSDNRALNGAGIAVQYAGGFTCKNVRINGNIASDSGGGLFMNENSISVVIGTSIYENHALYGAGAAALTSAVLAFSGGEIARNVATEDGGGIYLSEKGEAHIAAPAAIYENTAGNVACGIYDGGILGLGGAVDIPDGIYLVSEENLMRIEASLAGATVQLVESSYVYPENSRAPISVAEATAGYPVLTQEDEAAFIKPVSGFGIWYVE